MTIIKSISGLCAVKNEIVDDFIRLFSTNPVNSSGMLRQLQTMIMKQNPQHLPDTQNHTSIKINMDSSTDDGCQDPETTKTTGLILKIAF